MKSRFPHLRSIALIEKKMKNKEGGQIEAHYQKKIGASKVK
jgi:hypothetical protein